MDHRVSLRRFIVPALLAGLTLAWASSASARDPAARVSLGTSHPAAAARASHPTLSSTPVRSTSSRSPATTIPTKTVALHFTPGTPNPRYTPDGVAYAR